MSSRTERKEHEVSVVLKDRLELVKGVPLGVGSHAEPPKGEPPCGWCVMEKYAYLTGQAWTDCPDNCCPVIGAFLRRYNDGIDQEGRDRLDAWVVANADRLAATAGDGRREERGFMLADWAMRVTAPAWLEIAGVKDGAEALRALPPITDHATRRQAYADTAKLRDELWELRRERLDALRAKVRAEVEKRLGEKAAVADAAPSAVAAAAADAVAAAAAAAAASAAAAADAVAAAVAAAPRYDQVWSAAYNAVKDRYRELYAEKARDVGVQDSAFMLLDRLVAA